jgi:hypothetical protein
MREWALWRRAGFNVPKPVIRSRFYSAAMKNDVLPQSHVWLIPLDGSGRGRAEYDPYAWDDRTYHTAHLHIQFAWDELPNGALIDVRVLLGENDKPAVTELPIKADVS